VKKALDSSVLIAQKGSPALHTAMEFCAWTADGLMANWTVPPCSKKKEDISLM
jgi:hypothetical protein